MSSCPRTGVPKGLLDGTSRRPGTTLGSGVVALLLALAATVAACRKSQPPPPVEEASPTPRAPEAASGSSALATAPDPTDLNYWRERVRQVSERQAKDGAAPSPATPATQTVEPTPSVSPRSEARFGIRKGCEEKAKAAWQHFNEGAVASAEAELRALLANAPDCVPAQVMLGQLFYQRGELAEAIHQWESIQGLSPSSQQSVAALIAKVKRELGVEAGMGQRESAHFLVSFDGREDRDAARRTVEVLEEARSSVGRMLDFYPSDVVPVILYPGEKFREADGRPAWADGLYDGKIRLASANAAQRVERFKALLFHEYTHALVHRLSSGKPVPAWLNEGLAQHSETRVPGARTRVVAAQADTWVPLTALTDSFSKLDERRAELAYTEARVAVESLVQRYRVYRIKELLEQLGQGKRFEAAFEDTFLLPYERFARDPSGR